MILYLITLVVVIGVMNACTSQERAGLYHEYRISNITGSSEAIIFYVIMFQLVLKMINFMKTGN